MFLEYPPKHKDELVSIEVFRRISGAEEFIDQARKLAQTVLGEAPTSATVNLETESGQMVVVPAGLPYCDVFYADRLKLNLFTKRDLPENRNESRYNSLKRQLRSGIPTPKKPKAHLGQIEAKPSLLSHLSGIQQAHHFENDEEIELKLQGVLPQISPDIKNGSLNLALFPDAGTRAGRMLVAQAASSSRFITQSSKHVGFGTTNTSPTITFASLREIPLDRSRAADNFIDKINGLLPIEVTLHPPEIV